MTVSPTARPQWARRATMARRLTFPPPTQGWPHQPDCACVAPRGPLSNKWKATWMDLRRAWLHLVRTFGWLRHNGHPSDVSGRMHRMGPSHPPTYPPTHTHTHTHTHIHTVPLPPSGLATGPPPSDDSVLVCARSDLAGHHVPGQVHRAPAVPPTPGALQPGWSNHFR